MGMDDRNPAETGRRVACIFCSLNVSSWPGAVPRLSIANDWYRCEPAVPRKNIVFPLRMAAIQFSACAAKVCFQNLPEAGMGR
jgi:hypothetical protein